MFVDPLWVWPYSIDMAMPTIKSTYSLDRETARQLDGLAKHWNTSKSAALRRAIRAAARRVLPPDTESLEALGRLQRLLNLDQQAAAEWENEVKRERHAVS